MRGTRIRGKRGSRKTNIEGVLRSEDRYVTTVSDLMLEGTAPARSKCENTPLTLQTLFTRYYAARTASGAAERTLKDYRSHFDYLERFIRREFAGLETVTPNREVIRAWILHMVTVQKLKPTTVNIRLRTMKAMFNWALREKLVGETPFDNIELIRVPENDFKVLSLYHERKLFEQCDLQTWHGLRDALLISFLLETGVRIGECMRVEIDEVNITERSVLIRGESAKSRKARTVYFGNRTQHLLVPYLRWHELNALARNLFLNEYGYPMDIDWATKRISQLGKRARITGVRVSPHTLRHTFATRYIQATGDPFSLRRLLGHTTMDMVNKYVNQTTTEVRNQYQKYLARAFNPAMR